MDAREDLPAEPVADAARLIRSFVEDYHEKLEEDFLFPRFRKARRLVDLVDVLFEQHQAGRKLTEATIRLANAGALRDAARRGGTCLVGDVDFANVQPIAGKITPNPGGVGPMTIALLMANTVRAAEIAAA